jgi:exodeoxyribonuclease V alpha subunit
LVAIVVDVEVKRIRYKSENGCVFKAIILSPDGKYTDNKINVLITGKLAGEDFRLFQGQRFKVRARQHGEYINTCTGEVEEQIKATSIVEYQPKGGNFISYIASSKYFVNIGVKTATAIYKLFGNDIYRVLEDKNYDDLAQVDLLTEDKAFTLVEGWHQDKNGKLIEWLELYKLPIWLGRKLILAYSNNAIEKLQADPYRLIAFAIKWKKIDKIAIEQFGIKIDDPRRLHAAVSEILFSAYRDYGNTTLNKDCLANSLTKFIGPYLVEDALRQVYSNGSFILLTPSLYQSRGASLQEAYIANETIIRCEHHTKADDSSIQANLTRWQEINYTLTDEQIQAVYNGVTQPLCILTGGAGVGKTSVLEALLYVLTNSGGQAIQMALAGRAAKQMQDATAHGAITIASFLNNVDPRKLQSATHIIIDECSMVDIYSFVRIFQLLNTSQKIILVGDTAQLPPIGAGKVFHVLAETPIVPLTRLTKTWRQDGSTGIAMLSQSVRDGIWTELPSYVGKATGVSHVNATSENILKLIENVFDDLGGNSEYADVKVICPTTKDSDWGSLGINRRMSEIYAGKFLQVCKNSESGVLQPTGLKVGDTVMATVNNWKKEIMNGSLGKIIRFASTKEIDDARRTNIPAPIILVVFDSKEILIDKNDIDSLQWGYAITCHKAQGSQFRRVIIPIINGRNIDKTWVYTALTRGVEQVVFVGNTEVIKQAVAKTSSIDNRTVGLYEHIKQQQSKHTSNRVS